MRMPNLVAMRCPICRASIRLPLTSTTEGAPGQHFRVNPSAMIEHIRTLHPQTRVEAPSIEENGHEQWGSNNGGLRQSHR